MTPFTKNLIIFLAINFAALGIDGFLMGEGPSSDYYQNINKAPWTPPGWVFGAAWTTIMICFSIYMAYWVKADSRTTVLALFALQFVLNVGWNPLFFNFHMTLPALIVIIALTLLVGYFLFSNWNLLGTKSLLIAPYFIWLCIATSLNWYILVQN
jgi:tryptophan-rich sensory protein